MAPRDSLTGPSPPGRRIGRLRSAVGDALPRGRTLPGENWTRRHAALLHFLWAHVLVLPVFSLALGSRPLVSLGLVAAIALAAAAAMLPGGGRRARSVAVAFGLLTASAALVYTWDGQIEAHFHFFVVIAVLALYEDWLPFGFAITYVVVQHGTFGALSPHSVFNHAGNPWAWAAVHAVFVLGVAAASVVTWRLNEDMRTRMGDAHRRARETGEKFRLAFESGASGMALTAPDGRFMEVNRAYCAMLGYSERELLARDFASITSPEDVSLDLEQQRAMLEGTADRYETEKRYRHRAGHDVWASIGVSVVRDVGGQALYFILQAHDVTERRRAEAELAHRALHDSLTGLPNRALFQDRVRHALQRLDRRAGEFAVLFVDLDHFKRVNDGMGHDVGDAVLVEAARRLCEAARVDDTVARFGGDEFTILCENAGREAACRIARRVIDAVGAPFIHDGREFHLTASVGVRTTVSPAAAPDALVRDADFALYAAKAKGRARYEVFDPELRMPGLDRLAVEEALRQALRHGQLVLHYQPEVDLATRRIVAVEALVRWQHPDRGLVPPGEFIPVAEGSDLIVTIGEWVLDEACAQLARWRHRGHAGADLRMAVNVSPRQLADDLFPRMVADALASAGLDAPALCLEITETAVMHESDVVRRNLLRLKEMGVGLALDDFGTGFSSLSQIRELPAVDVIKVDRSFTAGLGTTDHDNAVVTAVLTLARSLGLKVVAEGVENQDQLERLLELGCDMAQGFHFARPQAADQVAQALIARPEPVAAAADPGS